VKIVICEDERYWHDALYAAIHKWAKNKKVEVKCDSFSSPQKLINYLSTNGEIDVLFLDISLGDEVIDGVAAARHIRKTGNRVPIIFVTVDSARAVDGYLVEAMGFLCKPIDEKRLSLFLDRIIRQKQNERTIPIMSETGVINVPQSEIVYVEIINHTIYYYTDKREISLRGTLAETLDLLGNENFVQVHRSYVVSKLKIKEIKATYPYSVSLAYGTEIKVLPVSRNFANRLMEMYADEVWEMMI